MPRRLPEVEQLDVEYQHPSWRVRALRVVVREGARDPEASFLTLEHELKTFCPPGDDAVERKLRRFTSGHRTVEHLTVRGPARVVHEHFRHGGGAGIASARREHLRRNAAGRHRRVGRCRSDIWRGRDSGGCDGSRGGPRETVSGSDFLR
jgi:hypothetical protein